MIAKYANLGGMGAYPQGNFWKLDPLRLNMGVIYISV